MFKPTPFDLLGFSSHSLGLDAFVIFGGYGAVTTLGGGHLENGEGVGRSATMIPL